MKNNTCKLEQGDFIWRLVSANILSIKTNEEEDSGTGILYLGDAENDNLAFNKALVSVRIISDKRLAPSRNVTVTELHAKP